MSEVVISGVGNIPVGEHWELSLREMGTKAIQDAIQDAGGLRPQALYIGNLLASTLSHQSNLGALLTEEAGLDGIESYTVEAAEASGAAAFRMGYLAVASGYVDNVLVLGVEKVTDVTDGVENALTQVLDYDYEAVQGLSRAGAAGLLMQRYLHEYDLPADALKGFPMLAHRNAVSNPQAMFQKAIREESYRKAPLLSEPLSLFDAAPVADGAAAVMLTRSDLLPPDLPQPSIRVLGSSLVIDSLSLHDRKDLLKFHAAQYSIERACRQAALLPTDMDLFEVDDVFSIYAALSLEAAGLAENGQGWQYVPVEDGVVQTPKIPLLTFGGGKARGYPVAANGMYQLIEAVQQLRGTAGENQVPNARRAVVQSLGGAAATAVTHVLECCDA
ncbi:MAG: thiolase domain-containing protein [Anaerolineaceae bacterium]|nr:thiolase domain-containing protein [Anaerolineaceae bacterium]